MIKKLLSWFCSEKKPAIRKKNTASNKNVSFKGRPGHSPSIPDASGDPPEGSRFPGKTPGRMILDGPPSGTLAERQEAILDKIRKRIEEGNFELPHLPSTSMVILDLSSNPSVDVKRMSEGIENDMVLASELIKTANSVMYHCPQPVETVQQAVMRLGIRNLRALILSLSMKNVISRTRGLIDYAEEIWRQSISVAKIANIFAKPLGIPKDEAFLIGLLHDIGKVALLDMVGKIIKSRMEINRALVGRVFLDFHEKVGTVMAGQWKLPDYIMSVAGCHHDYRNNDTFPKGAALASLCHKVDLYLSLGSEIEFWKLRFCDEVKFLQIPPEKIRKPLEECLDVYNVQSEKSELVEQA